MDPTVWADGVGGSAVLLMTMPGAPIPREIVLATPRYIHVYQPWMNVGGGSDP